MGDLQCAARVFVARHGEADQARALAESMAGERVARVWTSDMARAVQTAEIVAARLGVDVMVRTGLRECGVGPPAEAVERYQAVLDEIADAHRGESVLVISHGRVICLALPALARNLGHGRELPMPHCGVVALEADADGWVARSWAGRALE